MVSGSWASPSAEVEPVHRFSSKMAKVSRALKEWSAGLTSAIKRQANCCLLWIEWLDKAEELRLLVKEELVLRTQLRVRYDELCLQEEVKWKQRSWVHWLKAEDANTKFFHLKANARRSKNFISMLADGLEVCSDHASIADLLFKFFKQQLGSEVGSDVVLNIPSLYANKCPDLQGLHAPFFEGEVKLAVFSSAPDKAPRPDGFPLLFYQRFWRIIKGDLLEIFSLLL